MIIIFCYDVFSASSISSPDELRLETGDCIVLYTDGITEARGRDGSFFEEERLIKIIESSGDRSAVEIHDAIPDAMKYYETPDDVTLFVIKSV